MTNDDKLRLSRESLTAMLSGIQKERGYLSEEDLLELSRSTGIPAGEILSVATFYSEFRTRPSGRHLISVCVGTACHVKGAVEVLDAFKALFDIPEGEDTDTDGMFTVEEVACLGCCMLAPAVRIGDVIYGNLTPESVRDAVADFFKERNAVNRNRRVGGDGDGTTEVRLCLCSSCVAAGAAKVAEEIERVIDEFTLSAFLKEVGCTGKSYAAPIMDMAFSDGTTFSYGLMTPDTARTALLRHLKPATFTGRLSAGVHSLLDALAGGSDDPKSLLRFVPDGFHSGAAGCGGLSVAPVAIENAGVLSPLDIDEYISSGGFVGLGRVVDDISPREALAELRLSGLRGRGGSGFPTADKWTAVKDAASEEKFVICNADEGDPGAFMDRMILESFPFKVIEGMITACLVVGASEGLIYVRSEYPLAAKRAREAVALCESRGFLGETAHEIGMSLAIRVVEGAGAFVCGEESALIAALEGRRGTPTPRPPYPSECGFRGKPTLVNNVETFASIPWIFAHGAAEFAEAGVPGNRGTKTFALAGRIRRGGLVEVPLGTTIRELVFDIGGGIQNDLPAKAVLIGGPSGGCVPERLFDTPLDYESLSELGGMMGSGGMVVLDDTDCLVDIARYFLAFTQNESCGKCVFCRVGTKRMLEILEDLSEGRGCLGDIDEIEELALKVRDGSLCGLGRSAPNPVLTSLRYFKAEFEAHVDGRCPAGKCKTLTRYFITTDCIGCSICASNCPVDAIASTPRERHEIDSELCVRCGLCMKNCPTGAVRSR